ncbi:uncharacterized protein F4822DRAFT_424639 [Hypoxylon trugodes]|uniref:uncharacterized protein n=1 Tax=Hypoxylon trugodes TaxID=326681 RepID=UPI00218CEE16|nr:uncharacterized protein F4822DRAFT_424639 [Hypoxylon trugodes]KAI1394172.1 hypothetical protein F4822DRAFT_424639 [Hypoxylon trugodes]
MDSSYFRSQHETEPHEVRRDPNLAGFNGSTHQDHPRILKNGINIDDVSEQTQVQGTGEALGPNYNGSRSQTSVIQSSRNSPEPLQTDRQGHIVGPSSGVSFLLRIQKKLSSQASHYSSESSIFTFGDLPLPGWDGSFFILPPRSEAQELLSSYFEFAVATHRFLHRRTMENLLDELYETGGKMRSKEGARSRIALIFMMFACAKRFAHSADEDSSEASARYFSAAEHQLSEEKGEVRLTSIQARLAMVFYLLAESRMNHCWSLFGTLGHLIFALGIHRRSRRNEIINGDLVEHECRKRTFWVAYSLDAYLSCAFGRPRAFHDDDINQDLPACVDDSDLDIGRLSASPDNALPEMAAPIAQLKISQIIASVLREFYSLRTPSSKQRIELATKFTGDLKQWRLDMSLLLDRQEASQSLLLPLFRRQRNVLNLAYWHTLLLVHRPFLLNNFASLSNYSTVRAKLPHHEAFENNVQQCLDAAMKITKIIEELEERNQLHRAFWFTYYFASCAVVVLYVWKARPNAYLAYFNAASDCQSRIINNARNGSWVHRYGMVLEELRLEVLRHSQVLFGGPTDAIPVNGSSIGDPAPRDKDIPGSNTQDDPFTMSISTNEPTLGTVESLEPLGESLIAISPSSSIVEMTTWGQFDSLITGGFGNFDSLLSDPNTNWAWT